MKRTLLVVLGICSLLIAANIMSMSLQDHWQQHAFTFTSPSTIQSGLVQPVVAAAEPTLSPNDWPQWRGVNRDGKSPASQLLTQWPSDGPPLIWSVKGLGRGMSTVSIAQGQLFTMGKLDKQVCLIARRAETGEPLWETKIDAEGDPTGAPTIHENHVYAISYHGKVVCVERQTGKLIWSRDFVADFGGKVPTWGFCESPLVDGEHVLCTPGADDALIVALNRSTGETVWKTKAPSKMKGPGHAGAGYSSIVVSTGAGVRHYVQLVGQGVIGVSPTDGVALWGYNRVANGVASIPTPLVHQDYVFASTGYGAGAALLQLSKSSDGIQVKEVYFHPGNKAQNHHGGMVLVNDHVYFGHGQNNGLPMCIELLTGKIKWGPIRGPGAESAAIAYADGHLYFRYQNAVMALIEASPDAFKLKSSFKLPSHLDNSWPHPVIANEKLYLRDQDVLMCYDLTKH